MTDKDWAVIWQAYNFLKDSEAAKVEGGFFIIYKVGTIIRIDIKE